MALPTPPGARSETLREVERRIDQLTFDAGAREAPPAGAAPAPGPPTAPLAFHRIVLAVDGSEASRHAHGWAADLASRSPGARVWVTTVVPPRAAYAYAEGAPPLAQIYDVEAERAQRVLDGAVEELARAGIRAEAVRMAGAPAGEIVRLAQAERADLVVVGSHGRGAAGRLLLGSVADGVKDRAPCSVLVARTAPPPRRVLVATDGSRRSKLAAGIALHLAPAWGAHVTILHAVPPPSFGPLEQGQRAFEHAFGNLDLPAWRRGEVAYDLRFGPPAERIAGAARDLDVALVVMGSRGLSGLLGAAPGSVSNRVVHEAPCSVLLVKEPPGPGSP